MKIILISPMLQPYRITFYRKLAKLFENFTVFYGINPTEDGGRPQYNGNVNFDTRGFPARMLSIMGFKVRMINGMYRAIREERPDIIIIQGIPGNLTYRKIVSWARKNKTRVLFWYCGWKPNSNRPFLLEELKNRLSRSFYRNGHCFLTYSSKARNDLIKDSFDPQSVRIAYNGIELDDYENRSFKTEAGLLRKKYAGDADKVFLYVGGIMEEKRVIFLVDAFKKFAENRPGVQLWIIGDGPQREDLKDRISDCSSIRYFGRIMDNVEPYFVAADFFVLPGTGGLAISQAMYFETPCIVGRADGTEKDLVIEDVTGFNFAEDDQESLVSELVKAYELDSGSVAVMKSKCRELIIKQNNVNNMVKIFYEAITDLIQTGNQPQLKPDIRVPADK